MGLGPIVINGRIAIIILIFWSPYVTQNMFASSGARAYISLGTQISSYDFLTFVMMGWQSTIVDGRQTDNVHSLLQMGVWDHPHGLHHFKSWEEAAVLVQDSHIPISISAGRKGAKVAS